MESNGFIAYTAVSASSSTLQNYSLRTRFALRASLRPFGLTLVSRILSCCCCAECGLSEYRAIEGVITSPGYPDRYPNDLKCVYRISSLESWFADSTVTIIFDELDTEFHQSCDYDFILVSCSNSKSLFTRQVHPVANKRK